MGKGTPKAVQEGRDLLDFFYGFSRKGDSDRWLQKHEFRQDAYRIIIIQFHLAIEELVRAFLFDKLTEDPDPGTFTHRQNVEYVHNLNSRQVLDLAARLHVLSKEGYEALVMLNAIRNKCAHNWMLHAFTVSERIKTMTEPEHPTPRINFRGKNLLTLSVMKDEFIPAYGDIYLELFAVYYGAKHKHRYTDKALKTVEEV